jgi:hypothetical protein
MNTGRDYWGSITIDKDKPYNDDLRMNFTVEIAESRAYMERLFREQRESSTRINWRLLRTFDWDLFVKIR